MSILIVLGLTAAICGAAWLYKAVTAPPRSPWTDQRKDQR